MELQVWRVDPVDFLARGHTHVTLSRPLMGEGDVQRRIRGRKKRRKVREGRITVTMKVVMEERKNWF